MIKNMEEYTYKGSLKEVLHYIKLDITDRKILYLLSLNARLNNSVIAKTLNTSKEKVGYRIKRLEKKNILHGYMTVFNIQKLGYYTFSLLVKLNNLFYKDQFISRLNEIKEVNRILHLGGRWNMLLIFSVKKLEDTNRIIEMVLKFKEDIDDYLILQQIDEDFMGLNLLLDAEEKNKLQIKRPNPSSFFNDFVHSENNKFEGRPDKEEIELVNIIKMNARLSLLDISKKMKLTLPGAKYKFQNIVKKGFVRHFIPMMSLSYFGFQWNLIFFRTHDVEKDAFFRYMFQNPFITWGEEFIGRWNFSISIYSKNNYHFNLVLEDIKEKFADKIISYEILTVYDQIKFLIDFE